MRTLGGSEMLGGVTDPPLPMTKAAGMRTSVSGLIGLLRLGALLVGASGAVVDAELVVGPTVTVLAGDSPLTV